ncbi:MAG TPA: OmpA family protein, partial [Thioalkalivibrio sp.]|nr:OmpA family protein [Thioalkalivibrio sp.]
MLKKAFVLASAVLLSGHVFASTQPEQDETPLNGETGVRDISTYGATVEQYLTTDEAFQPWVLEDGRDQEAGDQFETRQVLEEDVKTIKLHDIVPSIHFESGEADIPDEYIDRLRVVLESMRDRHNVRLHFVGHTDNVPLSGALQERHGDNVGLSRERAGTTAEYFQLALGLPPEAISYEGMGEAQPVASNATAAGRAQNRRVDVEVWYDEITEKTVD